jgi:hypothetical protein
VRTGKNRKEKESENEESGTDIPCFHQSVKKHLQKRYKDHKNPVLMKISTARLNRRA